MVKIADSAEISLIRAVRVSCKLVTTHQEYDNKEIW
jgi:hypothetical protein